LNFSKLLADVLTKNICMVGDNRKWWKTRLLNTAISLAIWAVSHVSVIRSIMTSEVA